MGTAVRNKLGFTSPTETKPLTITAGDFDQSKWYRLYLSAMLEVDHALMAGRIVDARSEILRRLKALKNMPGYEPERLSMQDACSGLRGLEWGEARYGDERRRQAALRRASHRTGGGGSAVSASVPRIVFADNSDSD